MNILVACEESQRVCMAFRNKGHRAFSCDVIECSGNHPEWHIKQDVLPLLDGNCEFTTADGTQHRQEGKWDMIIAFPPCTYLSCAGNAYLNIERYGEKAIKRRELREEAADFFMRFINADCEKVAVENPVGYMNSSYRKPNQIIHPYYFAESVEDKENYHIKRTCLWLKGLEPLKRKNELPKPAAIYIDKVSGKKRNYVDAISGTSKEGKKIRSKTFEGVALAMSEQWG
jgi:hypothetical protein